MNLENHCELTKVDFTSLSDLAKQKVINLIEKLILVTKKSEESNRAIDGFKEHLRIRDAQINKQQEIIEQLQRLIDELNERNTQLEVTSKFREKLLKNEVRRFREDCKKQINIRSLVDDYKNTLHAMEKSLQAIEQQQKRPLIRQSDCSTQVSKILEEEILVTTRSTSQENILLSDLFFKKQLSEGLLECLFFRKNTTADF